MGRAVLYVAHPLGGDVDGNIKRALRWLEWLRRSFPTVTFIAPWIASVMSGEDDSDPAQREAGLVDAETIVDRCSGVVLVGGRISSGMMRESAAARWTSDLTWLGEEPPVGPHSHSLHGIAACVQSALEDFDLGGKA